MYFSGSQSEGNQKMTERRSPIQKHTSEETPRCVRCALLPGRSPCDRRGVRSRNWYGARRGRSRCGTRGALVDASVYLKPAKLVDVALDVLARLAPCLNLGVGELGHKDLLDTIGTDNCRK